MAYAIVALGGIVGATARFGLNVLMNRDLLMPVGTLAANLLGCLVMGVVMHLAGNAAWFNSASIVPDQYRLFFAVGFCGSFTTLSALVFEMHALMLRDEIWTALAYFTATLLGGFACLYVGIAMARMTLKLLGH